LSSFEGKGSFEGWLTRLTTNLCLNMVRSAKRRPEATVTDLSDDESDWLENRLADVSTARHESSERGRVAANLAEKVLSGMSPDDRTVLMLIDGEENSVKEVSEMTGWSESKVKTQAFRARRRMREAVEKLLGGRRNT
jgi:RNA polymerase sigma-70 factor (ECF subfamily)